jgi:hypothetical protein
MTIYLASILLFTILFWISYQKKIINVCPICAGTVVTWVIGISAIYTNMSWANPQVVAILMGASLGAVVTKYRENYKLLGQSIIILTAIPAIYFIINQDLWPGLILTGLTTALSIILIKQKITPHLQKNIDRFKDCC